jgi:hypothetical protein
MTANVLPKPAAPQPLLHSVNETRRLSGGVCRASIYNAIKRGELEVVRFCGRTMITDRSLRKRLGIDNPPSARFTAPFASPG